jgi:hypothetical protein
MVLDIDRDLHIVAHNAGAATARCHRAAVRVGQRYLLIWRSQHLFLHRCEALHLAFELGELLLEVCRYLPYCEPLACYRFTALGLQGRNG